MKRNILKVLMFAAVFGVVTLSSNPSVVYASPQDEIATITNKIEILQKELTELDIKIAEQSQDLSATTTEIEKRDKIINNMNTQIEKSDQRHEENISNLANELTTKLIETKTKSLLSGDKELSGVTLHPLSFSLLENNDSGIVSVNVENEVLKETTEELSQEKNELVKTQENKESTNNSLLDQKNELERNISNLKNEINRIKKEQEEAERRERIRQKYGVTVGSTNSDIVETALQYLGTPYVWGGTSPSGFDCSGFVQYVYRQHGINISRTTYTQIYDGTPISRSQLQPGDLVFPHSGHVVMYIGNGQVIHAPKPGDSVKISPLTDVWKAVRIR